MSVLKALVDSKTVEVAQFSKRPGVEELQAMVAVLTSSKAVPGITILLPKTGTFKKIYDPKVIELLNAVCAAIEKVSREDGNFLSGVYSTPFSLFVS